jgi:23S rRNA pseudouridine1911/1915/1917 synthase
MNSGQALLLVVSSSMAGERFDHFLTTQLGACSRSQAAALIRKGAILADDEPRKPSYRLKAGQRVCGHVPIPQPSEIVPQALPLDVLYEDADIIVINKQAGLVVHPAPGNVSGTLVNALLHHCPDLTGIGGEIRPGIVHRLDKQTSGVMVAAKNSDAHIALASQFKQRSIEKHYLALVHGTPTGQSGEITLPIGRHPLQRKKMSVITHRPRSAVTRWRVKESFGEAALLEVEIKTGRTHQIRVHLSAVGMPVIGDPVYTIRGTVKRFRLLDPNLAQEIASAARQMLHAWRLVFDHPRNGKRLIMVASPPADMRNLVSVLRT